MDSAFSSNSRNDHTFLSTTVMGKDVEGCGGFVQPTQQQQALSTHTQHMAAFAQALEVMLLRTMVPAHERMAVNSKGRQIIIGGKEKEEQEEDNSHQNHARRCCENINFDEQESNNQTRGVDGDADTLVVVVGHSDSPISHQLPLPLPLGSRECSRVATSRSMQSTSVGGREAQQQQQNRLGRCGDHSSSGGNPPTLPPTPQRDLAIQLNTNNYDSYSSCGASVAAASVLERSLNTNITYYSTRSTVTASTSKRGMFSVPVPIVAVVGNNNNGAPFPFADQNEVVFASVESVGNCGRGGGLRMLSPPASPLGVLPPRSPTFASRNNRSSCFNNNNSCSQMISNTNNLINQKVGGDTTTSPHASGCVTITSSNSRDAHDPPASFPQPTAAGAVTAVAAAVYRVQCSRCGEQTSFTTRRRRGGRVTLRGDSGNNNSNSNLFNNHSADARTTRVGGGGGFPAAVAGSLPLFHRRSLADEKRHAHTRSINNVSRAQSQAHLHGYIPSPRPPPTTTGRASRTTSRRSTHDVPATTINSNNTTNTNYHHCQTNPMGLGHNNSKKLLPSIADQIATIMTRIKESNEEQARSPSGGKGDEDDVESRGQAANSHYHHHHHHYHHHHQISTTPHAAASSQLLESPPLPVSMTAPVFLSSSSSAKRSPKSLLPVASPAVADGNAERKRRKERREEKEKEARCYNCAHCGVALLLLLRPPLLSDSITAPQPNVNHKEGGGGNFEFTLSEFAVLVDVVDTNDSGAAQEELSASDLSSSSTTSSSLSQSSSSSSFSSLEETSSFSSLEEDGSCWFGDRYFDNFNEDSPLHQQDEAVRITVAAAPAADVSSRDAADNVNADGNHINKSERSLASSIKSPKASQRPSPPPPRLPLALTENNLALNSVALLERRVRWESVRRYEAFHRMKLRCALLRVVVAGLEKELNKEEEEEADKAATRQQLLKAEQQKKKRRIKGDENKRIEVSNATGKDNNNNNTGAFSSPVVTIEPKRRSQMKREEAAKTKLLPPSLSSALNSLSTNQPFDCDLTVPSPAVPSNCPAAAFTATFESQGLSTGGGGGGAVGGGNIKSAATSKCAGDDGLGFDQLPNAVDGGEGEGGMVLKPLVAPATPPHRQQQKGPGEQYRLQTCAWSNTSSSDGSSDDDEADIEEKEKKKANEGNAEAKAIVSDINNGHIIDNNDYGFDASKEDAFGEGLPCPSSLSSSPSAASVVVAETPKASGNIKSARRKMLLQHTQHMRRKLAVVERRLCIDAPPPQPAAANPALTPPLPAAGVTDAPSSPFLFLPLPKRPPLFSAASPFARLAKLAVDVRPLADLIGVRLSVELIASLVSTRTLLWGDSDFGGGHCHYNHHDDQQIGASKKVSRTRAWRSERKTQLINALFYGIGSAAGPSGPCWGYFNGTMIPLFDSGKVYAYLADCMLATMPPPTTTMRSRSHHTNKQVRNSNKKAWEPVRKGGGEESRRGSRPSTIAGSAIGHAPPSSLISHTAAGLTQSTVGGGASGLPLPSPSSRSNNDRSKIERGFSVNVVPADALLSSSPATLFAKPQQRYEAATPPSRRPFHPPGFFHSHRTATATESSINNGSGSRYSTSFLPPQDQHRHSAVEPLLQLQRQLRASVSGAAVGAGLAIVPQNNNHDTHNGNRNYQSAEVCGVAMMTATRGKGDNDGDDNAHKIPLHDSSTSPLAGGDGGGDVGWLQPLTKEDAEHFALTFCEWMNEPFPILSPHASLSPAANPLNNTNNTLNVMIPPGMRGLLPLECVLRLGGGIRDEGRGPSSSSPSPSQRLLMLCEAMICFGGCDITRMCGGGGGGEGWYARQAAKTLLMCDQKSRKEAVRVPMLCAAVVGACYDCHCSQRAKAAGVKESRRSTSPSAIKNTNNSDARFSQSRETLPHFSPFSVAFTAPNSTSSSLERWLRSQLYARLGARDEYDDEGEEDDGSTSDGHGHGAMVVVGDSAAAAPITAADSSSSNATVDASSLVQLLLARGADANATDSPNGRHSLFYARTPFLIRLLVEEGGADIYHRDGSNGQMAIHVVGNYCCEETAKKGEGTAEKANQGQGRQDSREQHKLSPSLTLLATATAKELVRQHFLDMMEGGGGGGGGGGRSPQRNMGRCGDDTSVSFMSKSLNASRTQGQGLGVGGLMSGARLSNSNLFGMADNNSNVVNNADFNRSSRAGLLTSRHSSSRLRTTGFSFTSPIPYLLQCFTSHLIGLVDKEGRNPLQTNGHLLTNALLRSVVVECVEEKLDTIYKAQAPPRGAVVGGGGGADGTVCEAEAGSLADVRSPLGASIRSRSRISQLSKGGKGAASFYKQNSLVCDNDALADDGADNEGNAAAAADDATTGDNHDDDASTHVSSLGLSPSEHVAAEYAAEREAWKAARREERKKEAADEQARREKFIVSAQEKRAAALDDVRCGCVIS